MKKTIFNIISAAAVLALAGCEHLPGTGNGTLSFEGFELSCDDYVETKASSPASGNYTIFIYDEEENQVVKTTYSAVKDSDNSLSLPAGKYVLEARSSEDEVAAAEFEQPVYGASTSFEIAAGEVTTLESLTCTLLQCKVTISYSDDFLSLVTGNGAATVEVTSGYPLEYGVSYADGTVSYEQSAGYFAVNNDANTSMEVTFKGSIEGKSQKMTKVFTGISAKQWHQIKFVKKVIDQGTATFYVTIDDFVDDVVLNNSISGTEEIIGEDPSAPKGDGGILLELDYANGCDADFTDLNYLLMPSRDEKTVSLKLKATVPNGVKKFGVNISSTSDAFVSAVQAADAINLDLIHPSEDNEIIFQVVPFPHGEDLLGQTELLFDLSAAQEAITIYPGEHTFMMNITDQEGCKKSIPVVMVVL